MSNSQVTVFQIKRGVYEADKNIRKDADTTINQCDLTIIHSTRLPTREYKFFQMYMEFNQD